MVATMLKAYFDDSGTHAQSRITVIGGLIGTPQQWLEFERQWALLLTEPLPGKAALKKFHLAECRARKGEFIGYSSTEVDAVTYNFRQVIIDTQLVGIAAAIDRLAWNELIVGNIRERLGDAVEACIEQCLLEVIKTAEPHDAGDQVEVILDSGIWNERLRTLTNRWTFPMSRPRISLATNASVQKTLPLQGADIVATENYWHAIQVVTEGMDAKPRAHMQYFLKNAMTQAQILTREDLLAALPTIIKETAQWRSGSLSTPI